MSMMGKMRFLRPFFCFCFVVFFKSLSAFQESPQSWAESTEIIKETLKIDCVTVQKRNFVSPNCVTAMAIPVSGGVGGRVFSQLPKLSLKAHPLEPFPEVF